MRRALIAAALVASVSVAAAEAPRRKVLVWPRTPGDDTSGTEAAVREAGAIPVAFQPLGDALRTHGQRAAADETRALDAVQLAFAEAHQHFLKVAWEPMDAALARAETAALGALALQRNTAALWELELRRGVAQVYARPGVPAAGHPRFWFALSLDERRTPEAGIYNPMLYTAFTAAVDARSAVPPRPVAIKASPADAKLTVDGLPIVDNAAPRTLRPGLHVIHASAPGFAPAAHIVDLTSGQPLEIALAPLGGSALERIGATWSEGTCDPGTATGRKAILDAAVEAGATAVVIVDGASDRREAIARVLVAGSPELRASERGATAAAAVAAALARLDGGGVHVVTPPPPNGKCTALVCSWKLWAAVGAIALVGGGGYLLLRDGTYRILPPAM